MNRDFHSTNRSKFSNVDVGGVFRSIPDAEYYIKINENEGFNTADDTTEEFHPNTEVRVVYAELIIDDD